jgi:hypothetical protein
MFFLFFKHFIFKNILCMKYYKFFFEIYKFHVYNNKHKRYFFLFFFLIFEQGNHELYLGLNRTYN